MTRRTSGCLILALMSAAAGAAQAGPVPVSGRVVGADGKPVAGAYVGAFWDHSHGKPSPIDGSETDADGRFTLPVEGGDRPRSIMATDAERKLGGVVVLDPAQGPGAAPVEIKLAPLVRVHARFTCKEPNHPVESVGIYVSVGDKGPTIAQTFSFDMDDLKEGQKRPEKPAEVDVWLPPGQYHFQCYEPSDPAGHLATARVVEVKPGPDLDLGAIPMEMNPLERLYGKEPPPLTIKDARGVPRTVKLADYKGKWVVLEFWAHWCGPCVGRGIPDLVDLCEEYKADRDKFVVLTIHGEDAENFAYLDKKLAPIIKNLWNGRALPFPILLDDDGQTAAAFGVEGIPKSILIDPQGKVARDGVEGLREALPEIPLARQISRALDRQIPFGLGPKGAPLGEILEALTGSARLEIEPEAGVKLDPVVPLRISGQVSLRSWLDLILTPFDLVAEPGPEGLVVKPSQKGTAPAPLSEPQRLCAARIADKLATTKVKFDFQSTPLAEVAQHFETETGENFVLDPTDRKLGRIDLATLVTGKAEGVPLQDALKILLAPIGVEAVIRDEVVVLKKTD